jgi:hypothetical protein
MAPRRLVKKNAIVGGINFNSRNSGEPTRIWSVLTIPSSRRR